MGNKARLFANKAGLMGKTSRVLKNTFGVLTISIGIILPRAFLIYIYSKSSSAQVVWLEDCSMGM